MTKSRKKISIMKSSSKKEKEKKSTAANTSSTTKQPEIISLIEIEERQVKEAMKRSIRDAFSPRSTTTKASSSKKQKTEIIILSDSDDDDNDDGGGKMSRSSSVGTIDLLDNGGTSTNDDDDEIMVVDAAAVALEPSFQSATATSATAKSGNDDDEIMEIGIKNGMDLVHMRQHCTKHTFVQDAKKKPSSEREAAIEKNKHRCDKCYCYICDIPANDCKHWELHCNASDKGQDSGLWKSMREKAKKGIVTSTYPSTSAVDDDDDDDDDDDLYQYMWDRMRARFFEQFESENDYDSFDDQPNDPFARHGHEFLKQGPFEPDKVQKDTQIASKLKQCRKCKWWNKPKSVHMMQSREICVTDWCQACGRVMQERDFNKEQTFKVNPAIGDISLGDKVIPFRIKCRDPRKISPYDKNWKEHEGKDGWAFNENEMRYDFYRHRIGDKPYMKNLLRVISVLKEDKIPDKGSVSYNPNYHGQYEKQATKKEYSGLETEALLIENRNHRIIIQELFSFGRSSCGFGGRALKFDVQTNWNEASQVGNITISLFLTPQAMNVSTQRSFTFSRLLGAWYSVFPFKLSELTNGLSISSTMTLRDKKMILSGETGLRPKILSKEKTNQLLKSFDNREHLDKYDNEAREVKSRFSFTASSGEERNGGVCSSDNSMRGILCRYFKESLLENVRSDKINYTIELDIRTFGPTPPGQALGVQSTHRQMIGPSANHSSIYIDEDRHKRGTIFDACLEPHDAFILQHFLRSQLREKLSDGNTINGLLTQLENLHHKPVDHVEGLNVDLFDFQKEAVGWALEREKINGGVMNTLWTRINPANEYLTTSKQRPVELYYSPVLDSFRIGKPEEVKGGIIGEQMGLGKTVISLALILSNPAPATPLSASLVKNRSNASIKSTNVSPLSLWPKEAPINDSSPKHRAKYFCRGTLVVCNVSLVGQWIDEAKSKLKNPGLVYSYHGSSRKRCPMTLANNAIVVTTYATLASDSNYWRNKSKDPNYCPPCEQIWWWRIICDESHALKDQSTHHFRALNSIQAVHKWCVTGTPMNTSVKDLKGQLSFIGVDNVASYFSVFTEKMKSHFYKPSRRNSYDSLDDKPGQFLFMMRSIMIRHAIQMKSRAEGRSIMTLPPKEEKIIKITFDKKERDEYLKLEKNARDVYESIKSQGRDLISKNYLKISSTLLPLRLACSGGEPDEAATKSKRVATKKLPNAVDIPREDFQDECPICLDQLDDARATKCKPVHHLFCKECIEGCFDDGQTIDCPSCRTKVKLSDLRPINVVDPNIPDEGKSTKSDAPRKAKKTRVIKDLTFKSKFERLVQELKRIRDTEPESKTLVFSQFFSTLQWMKQELPKHGFQFRTLSGDMPMTQRAKALRDFQQDPPTTIFLLSMRSGAVGINLTQANRVFLMEPAMNPALEDQAVGRVYRLGQRKSVQVIRMCIEDSIESRLMDMLAKKYGNAKKPDPKSNDTKEKSKGNKESEEKNDEDVGNEEGLASTSSATAAATTAAMPAVGHMNTDKAALLANEFDLLFNVK